MPDVNRNTVLRKILSHKFIQELKIESRNQCAICGSKDFLQIAHITPVSVGGTNTADNFIVLCPTCHAGVDSSRINMNLLKEIKRDWTDKQTLGKQRIVGLSQNTPKTLVNSPQIELAGSASDLISWSEALTRSNEFDSLVRLIVEQISTINSEDDFINSILKPLFDALGYEGVTVLHHTGRAEYGKDVVFYERDKLGGFTYYAVVACIGKIHASSSKAKTHDSGHYAKILDQIAKCFELPYTDYNLKGDFHIDKVVVACSGSITEEAVRLLRAWENKNCRRLLYLDASSIAGHKLKLHKRG